MMYERVYVRVGGKGSTETVGFINGGDNKGVKSLFPLETSTPMDVIYVNKHSAQCIVGLFGEILRHLNRQLKRVTITP